MLQQEPVLLRGGFQFVIFGIPNFFVQLVKQWRMSRLEIIAAWRVHV
jgi:hypothetical protein